MPIPTPKEMRVTGGFGLDEQGLRYVRHGDYAIEVELNERDGSFDPVAVTIRRIDDNKKPSLLPLSGRDLRKLPFGRVFAAFTAAKAIAGMPASQVGLETSRTLHAPRGRPPRGGHSHKWWQDLADFYLECQARQLSPVKEIARRKNVSENTVHQWVYKLRYEHELLPLSTRCSRDW